VSDRNVMLDALSMSTTEMLDLSVNDVFKNVLRVGGMEKFFF